MLSSKETSCNNIIINLQGVSAPNEEFQGLNNNNNNNNNNNGWLRYQLPSLF